MGYHNNNQHDYYAPSTSANASAYLGPLACPLPAFRHPAPPAYPAKRPLPTHHSTAPSRKRHKAGVSAYPRPVLQSIGNLPHGVMPTPQASPALGQRSQPSQAYPDSDSESGSDDLADLGKAADRIRRKAERDRARLAGRYSGSSMSGPGATAGLTERGGVELSGWAKVDPTARPGGRNSHYAGGEAVDEVDEMSGSDEGGTSASCEVRNGALLRAELPMTDQRKASGIATNVATPLVDPYRRFLPATRPTLPLGPNPTQLFDRMEQRPPAAPSIIRPTPIRAFGQGSVSSKPRDMHKTTPEAPPRSAFASLRTGGQAEAAEQSPQLSQIDETESHTAKQILPMSASKLPRSPSASHVSATLEPARPVHRGPSTGEYKTINSSRIDPDNLHDSASENQQDVFTYDTKHLAPLPVRKTKEKASARPGLRRTSITSASTSKSRKSNHPASLKLKHEVDKAKWVKPVHLEMVDGKPPLWSSYRQELCESVSYYKTYQGGHYVHDNLTRGYLLDGYPSARDAVSAGGRVIVSHGGGKSEETDQGYQLKEDQTANGPRVKALLNCMSSGYPVVMVAGEKCGAFPRLRQLDGVKYAVLGFYKVTSGWTEFEPNLRPGFDGEGFVRWKFRFEWVASQGTPWFADLIDSWPRPPSTDQIDQLGPALDKEEHDDPPFRTSDGRSANCVRCLSSVDMDPFQEEVSCFSPACDNYFLLGGNMAKPEDLHFRKSFLDVTQLTTEDDLVPHQLAPESLQESSRTGSSKNNWEGIHCARCGRLSCRRYWDRLECANCHETAGAIPSIQRAPTTTTISCRPPARIEPHSTITSLRIAKSLIQGYTYNLGSESARIHRFWSFDQDSIKEMGDLFRAFQQSDVAALLKRNPMSRHKGGGGSEFLTRQISSRYLYVVAVGQHPFKLRPGETSRLGGEGEELVPEAPDCVRETLERAQISAREVIAKPQQAKAMNEVLTVGYFAEQLMSYHHDGEAGLGDIVSTLSLGSPATMDFRRRILKDQPKPTGKNHHPRALQIRLEHGDWIIMEGKEVQARWEHQVKITNEPTSKDKDAQVLRFAATSRCIGDMHEELMTPKTSRNNSGRTTPVGNSGACTPTAATTTPVKTAARARPHQSTSMVPLMPGAKKDEGGRGSCEAGGGEKGEGEGEGKGELWFEGWS